MGAAVTLWQLRNRNALAVLRCAIGAIGLAIRRFTDIPVYAVTFLALRRPQPNR